MIDKNKKNFHLLSQDIVDTYNESKENPMIQARAMEVTDDIDKEQDDDIDYDI